MRKAGRILKREETEKYTQALRFAQKKHKGQYRLGGLPYITHPVAVAQMLREQGYSEDYQITGLFHDLLEDTDATEAEIDALGGSAVLKTVQCLTKNKQLKTADYVARIRANPMAFAVKCADRLNNVQCAVDADAAFRQQYLEETLQWYWDFSPEIATAAEALAQTLGETGRKMLEAKRGKK